MKPVVHFPLIALMLLNGCQCSSPTRREIAVLPDISASIDPEARRQMFAAIKDVAFHLNRGDTLTIVSVRRTHVGSYRLLVAHAAGVSCGSLWMDKLASPGRTAVR